MIAHNSNPQNDDPRVADAGTIAGRAPAPVAPKPDEEHASSGSPGAIADRNQAKKREQPAQKDNTLPTK